MDYTKDVWMIPPVSSREHPAPFPQEIPTRLIRLFTHGDHPVVLDPFCGIGTSLLAAKELGRDFIGIEKEPAYVTIAEKRLEKVNNHKIEEWF